MTDDFKDESIDFFDEQWDFAFKAISASTTVSGSSSSSVASYKPVVVDVSITGTSAIGTVHKSARVGSASVIETSSLTVSSYKPVLADTTVSGASSAIIDVHKNGVANPDGTASSSVDTTYSVGKTGSPNVTEPALCLAIGYGSHHGTVDVSETSSVTVDGGRSLGAQSLVEGTAAVDVVQSKSVSGDSSVSGTATSSVVGLKSPADNTSVSGSASSDVIAYPTFSGIGNSSVSGTASVTAAGYRGEIGQASVSGASLSDVLAHKNGLGYPSISGAATGVSSGLKSASYDASVTGSESVVVSGVKEEFPPGVGNAVVVGTSSVDAQGIKTSVDISRVTNVSSTTAVALKNGLVAITVAANASATVLGGGVESPTKSTRIDGAATLDISVYKNAIANLDARGSPAVAAIGHKETLNASLVRGTGYVAAVAGLNAAAASVSVHIRFGRRQPAVWIRHREIHFKLTKKGD